MTIRYEDRLLLSYAANLARETRYSPEKAGLLMREVYAGDSFADLRDRASSEPPFRFLSGPTRFDNSDRFHENRASEEEWRTFREGLDRLKEATEGIPPDLLARRICCLGRHLKLEREDIRILEAWVFKAHSAAISRFLEMMVSEFNTHRGHNFRCVRVGDRDISKMLGISAQKFRERLGPASPLVRTGLFVVDDDMEVAMLNCLQRLLWNPDEDADVRDLLLGKAQVQDLAWSDYEHLGSGRDDVEAILRGAHVREVRGVNILLHGPPGTGKTTFCKALAGREGMRLFSVGERDDRGNEPTRHERLGELRLAQNLLRGDRGAVLLLDEMDDVLSGNEIPLWLFGGEGNRRGGESRVYLHRLLENTPVPTLWTTNGARGIDPAILRRMTFALEFRLPPTRIRAGIWSRQLDRHGIGASDAEVRSLAEEFEATPGVAEGAVTAGELGGGGFELVRRSVQSLARVIGCDRPRLSGSNGFDPGLACADIDLADLTERLEQSTDRRFSLCLQGPPGTGKSAYARYLAKRLDMEVLHKRASDLLGMYVGQSERNIADAFSEARDTGAFLIFDEADSLLTDRGRAQRSWEISQVNEMLTWMESHPLPFACTTNHGDLLDSATLRRFVFKVRFGYLGTDEVETAFREWFGLNPPEGLGELDNLTPGDFDVVRRKARLLDRMADGDALAEMLRAECGAKPGRRHPVGFVNHRTPE